VRAPAARARSSSPPEATSRLFLRALPFLRAGGEERGAALAAGPLGQFAMLRGDRERANTFLTEAKDHGEDWQASLYHCRIARQRIADGDYAAARAQLRLALEVSRAVQDQFTALVTQYTWAVCAVAENDPADARGHLVEGLAMAAPAGDEAAVAQFLSAVADLDSRHGDLERAVRLEAAAQALRTPSNEMWMRAFVAPWPATGPGRAAVRAQLGPDGFDGAWRDGEQLGVDRAVAEATAGR
ncbi:hypothetical protein, partial [Asanoa sp. NPDC050611]|uniref:hypothetical protein n=1 Tax=Asanoa sp. NPDC050611 TaxID=3157098 RepID=UPI003404F962